MNSKILQSKVQQRSILQLLRRNGLTFYSFSKNTKYCKVQSSIKKIIRLSSLQLLTEALAAKLNTLLWFLWLKK